MKNRFLFIICFLLFSVGCAAKQLIQGNASATPAQTFTFPVGTFLRDDATGSYFAAASAAGANEFSVARYMPGLSLGTFFFSLTPQTVVLNGQANTASPLYNQGISLISPVPGNHVAVVTTASPSSLFYIDELSGLNLLSLPSLFDAANAPTAGIMRLLSPFSDQVFAAVLGNGESSFGVGNSGIAVVIVQSSELQATDSSGNETKKTVRSLAQVNVAGGSLNTSNAAPFNVNSTPVFISQAVASMGTIIDLHWSSVLRRLYIAYDVVSAASPTAGARSVAVATLSGATATQSATLTIYPIAPDAVFTQGDLDEIIGGIGSSVAVTAYKVRTMRTSTSLDYLIVVGGNGNLAATQSNVYALPLTNLVLPNGQYVNGASDATLQGTLADVTIAPVDDFTPTNTIPTINLFGNRRFGTPATSSSGIYTTTDSAAQVGGAPVPAGPVNSIIVNGDTVFVTVTAPNADYQSGIYYSQAIFDNTGVIIAWTNWAPACGFYGSVFFSGYDSRSGSFVIGTGASSSAVNTFYQLGWGSGSNPGLNDLVVFLNGAFAQPNSGIQFLRSYNPLYSGILDIGVLVALGLNQVTLLETGITVNSVLQPLTGGYTANQITYSQGAITSAIPASTQAITFQNGTLATLGPLQAAEFATNLVPLRADTNPDQAWLFVGGVNGLAVLSDDSGNGWSPVTGLSTGFAGLVPGMNFKPIGNYQFVRALMADNAYLYVLTDTTFDKIDLNNSYFGANPMLAVVTLATGLNAPPLVINSQVPRLIDMVVSNKCAILATSSGILCNGPCTDVSMATSAQDMNWQVLSVASNFLTTTQFYPITFSGNPQDLSEGGGVLYVLNGYQGTDRSFLNRYAVQDTLSADMTSSTVTPMPDLITATVFGYVGNFGSYRATTATDGSIFLSGRNKKPNIDVALYSGFIGSAPLPLAISTYNQISSILRNGSSGSWMVAGDFGVQVNE